MGDMESRKERETHATIVGQRDTEQHNVGTETEEEAKEQEFKEEEKGPGLYMGGGIGGKGYKGKGGGKDGPGKATVSQENVMNVG